MVVGLSKALEKQGENQVQLALALRDTMKAILERLKEIEKRLDRQERGFDYNEDDPYDSESS